MGSVTPLKTDCAVSGTFHFILYLSRLAGTSPVKFEKVNVTLTSIYSLDRDKVVDGYESSNNTGFMRIALIIHLLVHYAVGGAITATGLNRMRHMIDCTARLQELWVTKRLVRRMRRYTRRETAELANKLKVFNRHIELNPVRFAPLKLLTFNRGLLIAVLSTIVTYLSVIIHL
ncbi:unnamed protein product [Arctia plantaginis]|uniref:Uncharacterized protein n=1 Tax=Arctia plantaginis TaxID=874455 RepID=A0A8S1A9V8_ARCPL|nr:unnamed protein product [Arctia plantaginis]